MNVLDLWVSGVAVLIPPVAIVVAVVVVELIVFIFSILLLEEFDRDDVRGVVLTWILLNILLFVVPFLAGLWTMPQ